MIVIWYVVILCSYVVRLILVKVDVCDWNKIFYAIAGFELFVDIMVAKHLYLLRVQKSMLGTNVQINSSPAIRHSVFRIVYLCANQRVFICRVATIGDTTR